MSVARLVPHRTRDATQNQVVGSPQGTLGDSSTAFFRVPSRCRRDLGTPRYYLSSFSFEPILRARFHGPERRLGVVGRWYEPRSVLICSYVPADSPPAASRRVSRTRRRRGQCGHQECPHLSASGQCPRMVHDSVLRPSKSPGGPLLASNWHFDLVSACFWFTTARDHGASSKFLYVCAP